MQVKWNLYLSQDGVEAYEKLYQASIEMNRTLAQTTKALYIIRARYKPAWNKFSNKLTLKKYLKEKRSLKNI